MKYPIEVSVGPTEIESLIKDAESSMVRFSNDAYGKLIELDPIITPLDSGIIKVVRPEELGIRGDYAYPSVFENRGGFKDFPKWAIPHFAAQSEELEDKQLIIFGTRPIEIGRDRRFFVLHKDEGYSRYKSVGLWYDRPGRSWEHKKTVWVFLNG